MMSIAKGFIFKRMDSPIHRLDPRIKLLMSIGLFYLALSISSIFEAAIIFSTIFTIATFAKITNRLIRTIFIALGFAIFIFLINYIVGYEILLAIQLSLRFITIISSTSMFFLITSPDELELVMKWMRIPRDFVFAFVTAVRFVPVLIMDATRIMDSQKSRGLELEKGNIIKRIRNFIPILIPLILTSIRRSLNLAEAMESRSYSSNNPKTSLYELKLKTRDKIALSIILITFFTLVYLLKYII